MVFYDTNGLCYQFNFELECKRLRARTCKLSSQKLN